MSGCVRQGVGRGAAPDWLSGQAAHRCLVDTPAQPFGPGLFAHPSASSLGHVSTYTPSFFLGGRANSSRHGPGKDFRQALSRANIIGFDYTDIIDNPEVRVPVINYLLHRLEALIDGRRLIYVMDEFWKILDGKGGLKEFAKNKQKTIRKQNGLGIFATQSPEDALASDIAASLIEQTATMILLPNPNASREDYVEGLKLTEAEYQVVVSLDERSRCFLVKQGHAASVCQLNLRGMDDALAVISASTDNIDIMHEVLQARAEAEGVSVDALTPEQWLQDFYDQRKGSGKQKPPPPRATRSTRSVA